MPELPEVETIKSDLRERLLGVVFTGVDLQWPGAVKHPASAQFVQGLMGDRIGEISRRGKYLLFHLASGRVLVVHLMMTGQLLLRPVGQEVERCTRTVFHLGDGWELRFVDQRKFGRLWLVEDLESVVGRLGLEPLNHSFSWEAFADALRRRSGAIKPLLLDQGFVAGIGNIYADEALYEAGIHPLRKASALTLEETKSLYQAILSVLRRGVDYRGTSFSNYRDAFGKKGNHQQELRIFRQTGKPCPRCGTIIRRIRVGGRGSHYCPCCQKAAAS